MVTVTGLKLEDPLILASGIMGTTGASLVRMARCGAGAVVTKSIGPSPKKGHPNPSMIQLECGFLNAMGLPNPSYGEFARELEIAKKDSGVPVICSIFGGNAEEFVEVAEGLTGADAFELNLSCPHAQGYGATIGTDPELVEQITAAVCDAVDVPVWVKLTPNVDDIVPIGEASERGGAAAVVAINTLRAMAIDIYSGYPILGNRYGGLSGAAVKPVAVKCVYDLYAAVDIPVIGVGGVSCFEDVVEMLMAGACAVEVGSAVYESPEIFRDLSSGVREFVIEQGYSGVEDLIGLAHEV